MSLIIHMVMKLYATLASVGVRDTGRSISMDGVGVILGTVTTVTEDCFYSTGTAPSHSGVFMMSKSGLLISKANHLST